MPDTVCTAPLQAGAVPRHYVDVSEIPTWGTADDGCRVRLTPNADLQEQFAAWKAGACQHDKQFTGKTVNAIGAAVFKRYCKHCGIATTQHLAHRTVADTTIEPIDNAKREKLIDGYVKARRAELERIASDAANRAQPERRSEYADYLQSDQWRQLRRVVMDRCGEVCEGCRVTAAVDVHHLTYRHVGREFAFELVGLCRECHDRWHQEAGQNGGDL